MALGPRWVGGRHFVPRGFGVGFAYGDTNPTVLAPLDLISVDSRGLYPITCYSRKRIGKSASFSLVIATQKLFT